MLRFHSDLPVSGGGGGGGGGGNVGPYMTQSSIFSVITGSASKPSIPFFPNTAKV